MLVLSSMENLMVQSRSNDTQAIKNISGNCQTRIVLSLPKYVQKNENGMNIKIILNRDFLYKIVGKVNKYFLI